MKMLIHNKSDCSKETWDGAMSFFNGETRAYLANRAAHGFTLIENQEGDIFEVYDKAGFSHFLRIYRNDEDEDTTYYKVVKKDKAIIRKFIKSEDEKETTDD